MRRSRIVTALSIVGLLTVAASLVAFHRAREGRAAPPLRVTVKAVAVTADASADESALSGQVEPWRVATIAAEAGERINARPVQAGDAVRRGQPLAILDTRNAQAAVDRAVAAAAQASAARRQAEADLRRAAVETEAARQQAAAQLLQAESQAHKARTYTRTQELRQAQAALTQARVDEDLARNEQRRNASLVRDGLETQFTLDRLNAHVEAAASRRLQAEQALSLAHEGARQEDINAAQAQVQNARAAVRAADTRDDRLAGLGEQVAQLRAQEAQAEAAVRQARVALDKLTVRAPFDGRVLSTAVEAGETVAAGTAVARVGEMRRVKVTFSVSESLRPHLALGQRVRVTADALAPRVFDGTVTLVGFQADARARSFALEVTVDNRDGALMPGMVARVTLRSGQSRTRVTVPLTAVVAGDPSTVFVISEGRVLRREVALGAPLGERVEVLRGLHRGDVVAANPQRLTDGLAVEVAR